MHVMRKRKVGRPRSQPQQQQVSTHDTTHPTSHPSSSSSTSAQANTMSNSCDTGSKHGRSKSLGIKGWGSGSKLKVQFDANNKPRGDEGNSLTGQLGIMVRNSYRVPFTYLNWKSVPNHIKEGIWKQVQDNLEFCPEEYESVCMDSCRRIYKDNKAKIKAEHYTSYMFPDADPNIALRVPDFVDPDQWKELVEYWQIEEVAAKALRNKGNRSWRGAPHNTGRTPFSQIRYDLAANGESLDKMSIYLQTRRQDNPEVKEIMFPDAASGHRTVRDQSIGGDTLTLERGHRTPTHSPGPVEQFGREVYLQTSHIPKYDVGEGLLISSDPDIQLDGERLGEGYCKVYVGKAIMPHVLLERTRPGVDTVGDALGRYVAWNFCDVIEKEMDDY
ncbi:uncharacterized protein LOC131306710 isoform X2 [Rhododendron vialii]|uniref:uncharacterized protein LOC131306710 isoform X2 n=1 Tax=Rhododendron vialii TaxID=182163 RepID=UPI00265F83EB|nr:uncharacterized protein LOC131306710 isoform X2 [Rhododendron vialii]